MIYVMKLIFINRVEVLGGKRFSLRDDSVKCFRALRTSKMKKTTHSRDFFLKRCQTLIGAQGFFFISRLSSFYTSEPHPPRPNIFEKIKISHLEKLKFKKTKKSLDRKVLCFQSLTT